MVSSIPYTITRNAQNGLPETVGDGKLTLSRTFSGYGELDQSVYTVSGTPLYSWTLSRDNAGRITHKIDVMPLGGVIWDYAYDTLGRLKEVKQSGSVVESYEYDENGNRTFETNTLRGTSNRAYSYSLEDHVLTAGQDTYQFDADGFLTSRITSAGTTTFTYSSRGELLSAALPDGTAITYDHDPMGRRIAKRVNGAIIEKYLWQGATRLLAVYDGSNNLVMRFTYADGRMPVSMTKGGVTYYLFYDQVGSLRAVVDGNGIIIKELVYDSFGYQYNESNQAFMVPFGFAGGLHDRDTGLIRFGARDYDPAIGHWTAKDPIGFAGGNNLYSYAASDPVNWIDPLGLDRAINTSPGGLFGPQITLVNDNPLAPSPNPIVSDATAAMIENAVLQLGVDVNINSTTGGIHGTRSRHGQGMACDINDVGGLPAYSAEFRRAFLFISGQSSDSIRAPSYGITERWVEATISQRFLLVND